jgi:hypothetical protein
VPLGDGEIKRGAAGAVPQADEARAGVGGEPGRHDSIAAGAGCVETRTAINRRREQKRLPASLDQSLDNLKMPLLARDMEAGESILVCLEKKCLPARLDEHLCNIKMPS